ncbi:MAG TPA: YciI family protein [Ignavibacteria bacterium]|nr:YciI family protein [Ignavibacteria bacterium]HMR39131.1 YciI family protein [Ignavibacteria bacterium]
MAKHFCYKLSLVPRLFRSEDWTKKDIETVSIHFSYLKDLLARKILFLAGRTVHEPMTDRDFGIAILEVDTMEEAREIMENDPAIKCGIMTGELFEFSLPLFRN